jgi:hypothetical protein
MGAIAETSKWRSVYTINVLLNEIIKLQERTFVLFFFFFSKTEKNKEFKLTLIDR